MTLKQLRKFCKIVFDIFIPQDDNSILTDSPSYERDAGCNNLYQQFFSTDEHDEHALFNELLPEGKPVFLYTMQ